MHPKIIKTLSLLLVCGLPLSGFAIEPAASFTPMNKVSSSKESDRSKVAASDEINELPFSRLFTTPSQRDAIDLARRTGKRLSPQVSGIDEGAGEKAVSNQASQSIKLMGILLRADGKNRVWIQGADSVDAKRLNNKNILGDRAQSATLKVPLRDVNSGAILKPGQVWNIAKQRTEEAYQQPFVKSASSSSEVVMKSSVATVSTSVSQASSSMSSEVHSSVDSRRK